MASGPAADSPGGGAELLRRFILRHSRGPLRVVWRVAYEVVVRAVATSLRRRSDDVSVYLAGSLGRGEAVYGLSDLDMIAVTAGDRERPGRRRQHLAGRARRVLRAFRPFRSLVSDLEVCEAPELALAVAETVLTHGSESDAGAATVLADTGWSLVAGLQERPGVGRPLDAWRLVAGPERRPALPRPNADRRRVAAWLELQFWWRHAFAGSLRPDALDAPYVCIKLVSESLRAWLWLEHGLAITGRREVFARALGMVPEEEPVIRQALALEANLHRCPPAPLADAIGLLTRISARVAMSLAAAAEQAGTNEVRLIGHGEELVLPSVPAPAGVLPLVDWRAIVAPRVPEEGLQVRPGDPADPAALAAAAMAARPGLLPALHREPLVVLPSASPFAEVVLRAVQCQVTDPVTLALLNNQRTAAFPRLPGWSVRHVARRAVAEHAAWLAHRGQAPRPYAWIHAPGPVMIMGRLLTAARAATFASTVAQGEPKLPLSIAATAALAEHPPLAAAVEEACAVLRQWHWHHEPIPEPTISQLERAVRDLYRTRVPAIAQSGP